MAEGQDLRQWVSVLSRAPSQFGALAISESRQVLGRQALRPVSKIADCGWWLAGPPCGLLLPSNGCDRLGVNTLSVVYDLVAQFPASELKAKARLGTVFKPRRSALEERVL